MAINLKSTATIASSGVKVLVYGQAGSGKTTLIRTAPAPLILSAEAGLLSLAGTDIPYVEIHSLAELSEVGAWIAQSQEAAQYRTICLDSISEIAEVCLSENKYTVDKHGNITRNDGRLAYGDTNDQMAKVIRAFRDLPGKNVYFSAKLDKSESQDGARLFAPSMPGKTLTQQLPYFFDEVLALRLVTDKDGNTGRALMCAPDTMWTAKDRSAKLAAWEPADLGKLFDKIAGSEPRKLKGTSYAEAMAARAQMDTEAK